MSAHGGLRPRLAARIARIARIAWIAALAVCLPLLSACGGAGNTGAEDAGTGNTAGAGGEGPAFREIRHTDGSEIRVPEEAERIGAIYGPSYETLALLGAEDRIVVRADVQADNFPWAREVFPRIAELPVLDNVHSSVNTELLKKYRPDLVFTFSRPNELRRLEALDICAVWGRTALTLNGTKDQLRVCAEALGGTEAAERAERYAEYFDEKLAGVRRVTDAIPPEARPRVYYAGVDLLTTYGRYSDAGELISAAGGLSVTTDIEGGNHVQIDFEQLAARDPEFIFIDHGAMNERATVEEIMEGAYGTARYQAVSAVRNRQLYLVPSGVYYWDMGLQKILLLMYMAKTLHPEAFADLDLEAEVAAFYTEFFDYPLTVEQAGRILAREGPA
jgi:iron complex transport system substrate-binding protein